MDGHYYVPALVIWLLFGFFQMKTAEKLGCENTWFAFIPILDLILLCAMARKPLWWVLLFLIPIVQFFVWIILWIAVCQHRRKEPLLGLAMIVPPLPIFLVGYLAFSE